MKKSLVFTIFALLMLLVPSLVWAEAGDHKIRANLQYVMPMGSADLGIFDELIDVEADSAIGFGFGYEYMATDLIGIDANISYSCHDIDFTLLAHTETIADTSMMPLTVGVNFHLLRNDKMNFYLGPFLGYVVYDDYNYKHSGESVPLENDFTFGAVLGIDAPIGQKGWMFSSALKFLQTEADYDHPDYVGDLDINPFIIQIGLGYRF